MTDRACFLIAAVAIAGGVAAAPKHIAKINIPVAPVAPVVFRAPVVAAPALPGMLGLPQATIVPAPPAPPRVRCTRPRVTA